MEIVPVCLMLTATLSILPDRSHFFYYDTLNLSCAVPGTFSGWTVKRNTSSKTSVSCKIWGQLNGSSCTIKGAYPSDSGVYWCESERGECSNKINITVKTGVILESPALPLTEGDNVTLRCSYKDKYEKMSTSNFSTGFYKNDVLLGKKPDGKMILTNVSKADQGFYKCGHPTEGESPQTWLDVRARVQPTSDPVSPPPPLMSLTRLVCTVLLFIFYTGILILYIYTNRKLAQARADAKMKDHEMKCLKKRGNTITHHCD